MATIGSANRASVDFDRARERFCLALDALLGDGNSELLAAARSLDSLSKHAVLTALDAASWELADAITALEHSGQELTKATLADLVREGIVGAERRRTAKARRLVARPPDRL